MLSDPSKLAFLAVCFFGCLATWFTSSSYTMLGWSSYIEVGTLNPPIRHHCRIPRQKTQQCLKKQSDEGGRQKQAEGDIMNSKKKQPSSIDQSLTNNNEEEETVSCSDYTTSVTKCELAVKRAYYQINMSCSQAIHAVTLCEREWCSTGGGSSNHHHNSMNIQQLLQQQQQQQISKKKQSNNSSPCETECAGVRESVHQCVQQHVTSYFTRYGLNEDGVIAT